MVGGPPSPPSASHPSELFPSIFDLSKEYAAKHEELEIRTAERRWELRKEQLLRRAKLDTRMWLDMALKDLLHAAVLPLPPAKRKKRRRKKQREDSKPIAKVLLRPDERSPVPPSLPEGPQL
eukprot:Sspe_Gene.74028::Locus_45344_Transcript_1_1_Confidence_1.000_Length_1596::g.74028::m.74028